MQDFPDKGLMTHKPPPAARVNSSVVFVIAALLLVCTPRAYADLGGPAEATVYGAQVAAMPARGSEFAQKIGRPGDINELMRRMLQAIQAWSSYGTGVRIPELRAIPIAQLQQRFCGRVCAIRAAYVPGEGVYIDAAMRPLIDRYHQSILFHELVHHVQVENVSHSSHGDCHLWSRRERKLPHLTDKP
jgi:hypothetical protein